MQYQLRITGKQRDRLYNHLFPGDGLEAVAVVLCGHHIQSEFTLLMVHDIFLVPHDECERNANYVHWKTDSVIDVLEKGANENLSFFKFHSHPTGYNQFSELDDMSDKILFPSVYGWNDEDQPHGSCVMLPNKNFFGRIVESNGSFVGLQKISICDHQIEIHSSETKDSNPEVSLRNLQTFGSRTNQLLRGLKIGVVGASGTGSPTIEQLARLGVGELVIVDPDKVEKKNLNRILNCKLSHAITSMYKVDVISQAVSSFGFDTIVHPFPVNLYDSIEAIHALISCDVIFGCVDSIDGRHLINQIATYYTIPYFDIGVKLEADGNGGIAQINGAVHFLLPGGSSLLSRGVYSLEGLEAAGLMRQNPHEYERRKKEKYIVNLPVASPAVISINMLVSSYAVTEFLDRIHSFKANNPKGRSASWISISEGLIFTEIDENVDEFLAQKVGKGDTRPFLNIPGL